MKIHDVCVAKESADHGQCLFYFLLLHPVADCLNSIATKGIVSEGLKFRKINVIEMSYLYLFGN